MWGTPVTVTTEQFSTLIQRIFRQTPLKVCLLFVALCLILKENFPFSHFPMYQSFSDYSFIVYVADKNGAPIPVQTVTGIKTSKIKKIFKNEQEAERARLEEAGTKIEGYRFMTKQQRKSAGEAALVSIFKNTKAKGEAALREAAPLRIYYVHLRMGDSGFEREEELIAEMAAPGE